MTKYKMIFRKDEANSNEFYVEFNAHNLNNAIKNAKRYARKNGVIFDSTSCKLMI